jgi:uncharacterized membrane protein
MESLSLYGQAAMYIGAGLLHFLRPKAYLPIMPPYLPAHRQLVFLSGVAEVVLGSLLLYAPTRPYAAWGIIAMLLAFLTVHEWMLRAKLAGTRFRKIPAWTLWLRLPLQGFLIWWAYQYT